MLLVALTLLAVPLHSERDVRLVAVSDHRVLTLSDTSFGFAGVTMRFPASSPKVEDRRVRYANVFPGVDLVVYGGSRRVEYDWVVAAEADPRAIRVSFPGASGIRVDASGDLVIGAVRHRRPFIYQLSGGRRVPVAGSFQILADGGVGFQIGAYDQAKPLVIDPQLVYQKGFGGTPPPAIEGYDTVVYPPDVGSAVAVDRFGNVYVAGTAFSSNFPLVNSLQPNPQCPSTFSQSCSIDSLFFAEISADGNTIIHSTYLGAPSQGVALTANLTTLPVGVTVDSAGNAYITGTTNGSNFPQVGGGVATVTQDSHVFVLKFDASGTLVGSLVGSLLPGSSGNDVGTTIALGPDGYLYVAGTADWPSLPTVPGFVVAPGSEFLMKLDPTQIAGNQPTKGTVVYSTYLGTGTVAGLAVDPSGAAYLASNVPARSGCVAPAYATCGTVMKVSSDGSKVVYSQYVGPNNGVALSGIAIDAQSSAYTVGSDVNSLGLTQPVGTGFVAKLTPDGTGMSYQSIPGAPSGIAIDPGGNLLVFGGISAAGSSQYPTRYPETVLPLISAFQVGPYYSSVPGYTTPDGTKEFFYPLASAGFLISIKPDLVTWNWSTYLGRAAANALALDADGNAYAVGTLFALAPEPIGQVPSSAVNVVKISPNGSPLQFNWSSITDAAAFQPGLPVAGGLASLTVTGMSPTSNVSAYSFPLPTELAGVSVLTGGVPAPLLSVSSLPSGAQQIIFQVAGSGLLEVRYQGISTYAWPFTVGPGIFGRPDGTPAVQHASDGSFVTTANPATPGEGIVIWATGLGPVAMPVTNGTPATGADPISYEMYTRCSLGTVTYAGLAPGYVGLYQANVTLSLNLPSGSDSLYLTAAGPVGSAVVLPVQNLN